MAVRNFYLSGSVDGRKTEIGSGPRGRDGGMSFTITQREKGNIKEVIKIWCIVEDDGTLTTAVKNTIKNEYFFIHTER